MKSCVILFSGGVDSTTALYWALARYDKVYPLTFDYGQRHAVEIRMACRILRRLKLPRTILKVDLRRIGGSALTESAISVPRTRTSVQAGRGTPLTYVPFRNGIFLALASAWAEVRGVTEIVCGFHVLDSPEYPDTRKEFVNAMEKAVNAGTRAAFGASRIRIRAPFIGMTKSGIIRLGLSLGADYSHSVSCYSGKEAPCGVCSTCRLRAKAWREIGREDPLIARLKKGGHR
jgi:7-cyano-7-deazaguanine synthase